MHYLRITHAGIAAGCRSLVALDDLSTKKGRRPSRDPGIRSGGRYSSPTVSSLKASINVRRARYALMMSLSRSERLAVAVDPR